MAKKRKRGPKPNRLQLDDENWEDAVKKAVTEAVGSLPNVPSNFQYERPQDDPERPVMEHVSLDLSQGGDDLQISHGDELGKDKEGTDDGEDKLKRLREIKRKK